MDITQPDGLSTEEFKWHRTKLDPEVLSRLNERSDVLGAAQTLTHFFLWVGTFVSVGWAWTQEQWLWLPLALFAHGTMSAFAINAVHELIHGTVFKTSWLNSFWAHVFGLLYWNNNRNFWYSHTEHHKYTLNAPHDCEVVNQPHQYTFWGVLGLGLVNPYGLRFIWFTILSAFGYFPGKWDQRVLSVPGRKAKVVAWARFIVLTHFAVAAWSIWQGHWWVIVAFSLPQSYGGLLMHLCNNTQHAGLPAGVKDFRLNCRTVKLPKVLQFLYWHMNFHIEHHMYAAVPCYRLPALHRAIKHELPPTAGGLIEAWTEIGAIMIRQKRDKDYVYYQPLPGNDNGSDAAEQRAAQLASANDAAQALTGRAWECQICGFIYYEARGLPEEGIAAGTAWEDIPDDFRCPDCGLSKSDFEMRELGPARTPTTDPPLSGERGDPNELAPVVIVGSGLAGYTLAKEIRAQSVDREVVLVTEGKGEHFYRPSLSKSLARGRTKDDLVSATRASMEETFALEVIAEQKVLSFDPERKIVKTTDREISYGDLVLATGTSPRQLALSPEQLDKIIQLDRLEDFDRLRLSLSPNSRVVVVGGGYVGCEIANDLLLSEHQVTLVEAGSQLLTGWVPQPIAETLVERLSGLNFRLELEATVRGIEEEVTGLNVLLEGGQVIPADVIISAIGVVPRTELASAAGVDVSRGICVDETLRTSVGHVFALGDCAEQEGRLEFFVDALRRQAKVLAGVLAGAEVEAVRKPSLVRVHTSSCPIALGQSPSAVTPAEWQLEGDADSGFLAIDLDAAGCLRRFVAQGARVEEAESLLSRMGEPYVARRSA